MWLFTETGFLSAVAHFEDPEVLVVRAREETSLRRLSVAAETAIVPTPANDYPFRIHVGRDVFAEWLLEQVSSLNYTNYKSHMVQTRGHEFTEALHAVWAAMHAIETPRVTQEDRDRAAKWYPKVNWTDKKIEMAKALGHL
jgi:hypothetical protein